MISVYVVGDFEGTTVAFVGADEGANVGAVDVELDDMTFFLFF